MTAEEFMLKRYRKHEFSTEAWDSLRQDLTDYLNSQRDTIFMEELEKRLNSLDMRQKAELVYSCSEAGKTLNSMPIIKAIKDIFNT